jgi:hypothetical protein
MREGVGQRGIGGVPNGRDDKPIMMAFFMRIEYVHIERLGRHQQTHKSRALGGR